MTGWATVASFATAAGTLVLGAATSYSVRSANRSARVAERSSQIGLRPILTASRQEDPPQRIMFGDRHWVNLEGAQAAVEFADGVVYLAMMVRNVGNGMAMIQAWRPAARQASSVDGWGRVEDFRAQTRALWVAPGDVAFWHGTLRKADEEIYDHIRNAMSQGAISVDRLCRDHEGGQRTISRFRLIRRDSENNASEPTWWTQLTNHHALDEA